MKKTFLLFLYFFSSVLILAQKEDSLAQSGGNQDSLHEDISRFHFEYKKLIIPSTLMFSGVIFNSGERIPLINLEDTPGRDLLGFENYLDDYLQAAPFIAVYGFEFAGMKPKTDIRNRTAILVKGQIVNLGLVYILKKSLKQTRPDGTAYSFPSGHTANAFAGATMLSIEYGKDHKWVPYASYAVASGVGVMRITNDKHYISDVLFGAGLGILSMKVAYWTHQYKWNKPKTDRDPLAGLYFVN